MKIESKYSTSEDDSVIPILLKYFYYNFDINKIKNEIIINNIFNLMSSAHAYGVIKLMKHLSEIVINEYLKEENCIRVYYEALLVNLNK